jgi:hypothetical protein
MTTKPTRTWEYKDCTLYDGDDEEYRGISEWLNALDQEGWEFVGEITIKFYADGGWRTSNRCVFRRPSSPIHEQGTVMYVITYEGEPLPHTRMTDLKTGHIIAALTEEHAIKEYEFLWKSLWKDRPKGIECEEFELVKKEKEQ